MKYIKPDVIIKAENNPVLLDQIIEEVGPRVKQIIEAATVQPLNRYNLRAGRIFGKVPGKDRFRIIELSGNVIVYKDLIKDKINYEPVDDLLKKWNQLGIVEISVVDSILEQIKSWLTPFLGGVIVAALIAWLMKKIGK